MMFDSMCRIAERAGIKELSGPLRYASLVDMRSVPVSPDWADDAKCGLFRMPWKVVAIEDSLSCAMIERLGRVEGLSFDGDYSSSEPAERLRHPNEVVDRVSRSTTADVGLEQGDLFRLAFAQEGKVQNALSYAHMAIGGRSGGRFGWVFTELRVFVEIGGRVVEALPSNTPHGFKATVMRECVGQMQTAAWQCVQATQPGTWIVADVDSEGRADAGLRSRKIPRSHQRKRWLVISDQERRRCFRESVESTPSEGRDVTPHARRAHYRHIGENDDGTKKYTWVRACWVGSTEAEIRGQKYRVELEL